MISLNDKDLKEAKRVLLITMLPNIYSNEDTVAIHFFDSKRGSKYKA